MRGSLAGFKLFRIVTKSCGVLPSLPTSLRHHRADAKRRDPVIQVCFQRTDMHLDCRVKPGNDGRSEAATRAYFSAWHARMMRVQASRSASVEVAYEMRKNGDRPNAEPCTAATPSASSR